MIIATRSVRLAFVAAGLCLAAAGCGTWPRRWSARPCCIEMRLAVRRQAIGWHLFDVTAVSQLKKGFQVARWGRRLLGLPVRAVNLKDGEVADTAFFTNRDPQALSPEEVRRGPTAPGDAPLLPFRVTKPKLEGKTPGFFMTDARGARYLCKLDPADAPELLSGAEVVTSKLLFALGYHVPSYEVLVIEPADLVVEEGVVARDASGELRPFGSTELAALLAGHLREGRIRVVASRILEGEILGPARFKRFRDCAEVRALRLAYAWVNNVDTKDHNSLLVWNGQETAGYLIDFGTSLGADAGLAGPKTPCEGWLNAVDMKEASLKIVTLGLHRPLCDPDEGPVSPGVGFFSPHLDPGRWKPYAPNLAFDEMNEDDARWIARRIARLSRAHIEAAVSAGRYSDPADAGYLVEALIQRQQAIIRRYGGGDPSRQATVSGCGPRRGVVPSEATTSRGTTKWVPGDPPAFLPGARRSLARTQSPTSLRDFWGPRALPVGRHEEDGRS